MSEQRKTAHCPNCGSQDIREKNTAYAELPVFDWELNDDETKVVCPADYDLDVEVDWETADVDDQYVCRGCDKWSGQPDELVIRDEAPR